MSDLNKPRRRLIWFRGQLVECNRVKDVIWEATDHSKETQLLQMDIGSCSKRSSHEHYEALWSCFRKFLKLQENLLVV